MISIQNLLKGKCNLKEMRMLISAIINMPIEKIFAHEHEIFLNDNEVEIFNGFLERYNHHEPISKIINRRSFWKHDFFINNDVLDPRPETELILETVISRKNLPTNINILDIGTGSGCIILSLALEFPKSQCIGIDISQNAIDVAEKNKNLLQCSNCKFICIDWNDFSTNEKFDVIVTNPPYIKRNDIYHLSKSVREFDPIIALDGGESGIECYEEIIPFAADWLKEGGLFVCEIGKGECRAVANILKNNGFLHILKRNDLAKIPRILIAHK